MSLPRQELSTYGAVPEYPPFMAEGRGKCAKDGRPNDFTEDGSRADQRWARQRARKVCYGCPFQEQCKEWAIEKVQQGVYGGTTTRGRRWIRAARNKQHELQG